MSAVLTRRRPSRAPVQPSLFSQLVQPPPRHERVASPPQHEVDAAPAQPVATPTLTLDEAISSRWDRLLAGEQASCPVCGGELESRSSATGGELLGARCGSCSTTLT